MVEHGTSSEERWDLEACHAVVHADADREPDEGELSMAPSSEFDQGSQTTLIAFVRLNVLAEQKGAASRYQSW